MGTSPEGGEPKSAIASATCTPDVADVAVPVLPYAKLGAIPTMAMTAAASIAIWNFLKAYPPRYMREALDFWTAFRAERLSTEPCEELVARFFSNAAPRCDRD